MPRTVNVSDFAYELERKLIKQQSAQWFETVDADHEQLQLGTEVALRNAQLLDRIRLWSKCADGYPLDEHINNIAVKVERQAQELEQLCADYERVVEENDRLRKLLQEVREVLGDLRMGEGANIGCWCIENPSTTREKGYRHRKECKRAQRLMARLRVDAVEGESHAH
jgi:hypothetical protein